MPPTIRFRPITGDDRDFLFRVYAGTREEELAVVPWSDDEKHEFLQMQFAAQHQYYQEQFADAQFDVIVADDEAVGRLYVDRREEEHRIVDIALLPEYRGRGIGGRILKDLLDEATAAGKPVRIHVERNNPALHLYHRLGFLQTSDAGVYLLMEWTPIADARLD
jgi:ribosomal protein S18 acetylase RimI-like enzyme